MANQSTLNYSQRLSKLRAQALGFFIVLILPLAGLLYFVWQQMEDNLLAEYERETSSLILQINRTLYKKLTFTNTLVASEFEYYQYIYNPVTKQTERRISQLANLDLLKAGEQQNIKGLLGFFQYDSAGNFNSPVWPYAISNTAKPNENQELSPELLVRQNFAVSMYQSLLASKELQSLLQNEYDESLHYFSIIFDIPDHLIFYRVVFTADEKKLQGYVVQREAYLREHVGTIVEVSDFATPVLVSLKDNEHSAEAKEFYYSPFANDKLEIKAHNLTQQIIAETRLEWPYRNHSVTVSTEALSMTQSMILSLAFLIVLVLAILVACYGFYRLGVKQLALGEQRLNFVSAVSHELKTPLTSIQMYSQMLQEGTVISDEHKKDYYQFIYAESERLTRLINNILQLNKLSHNVTPESQLECIPLVTLADTIKSKTAFITDKFNFKSSIHIEFENADKYSVLVDQDAFSQVVINITDNAVKFFEQAKIEDADRRKVEFIFRLKTSNDMQIQLEIRDYGAGITKEQEEKIFELFYRGESELTRSTQGTGIGLALVRQLMVSQQGEVEVQRRAPGLSMLLTFKAQESNKKSLKINS